MSTRVPIGRERFIRFHKLRHPLEMNTPEIEAFLTWLAVEQNVAPSTQNQALSALLFLYRHVLGIELTGRIDAVRAQPDKRLPVVLTKAEVQQVITQTMSKPRRSTSTSSTKVRLACAARWTNPWLWLQFIKDRPAHRLFRDAWP